MSSKKEEGKKKTSSSKTDGKSTKKEKTTESKEKSTAAPSVSIATLETNVRTFNENVIKLENQMKEKEEAIILYLQNAYNKLNGAAAPVAKEAAPAEGEKKQDPGKLIQALQKEEAALMALWFAELEKAQKATQELRLALCTLAAERQKSKGTFSLDVSTSQVLSQTTLSSTDDTKMDWSAFKADVNPATLQPAEWDKQAPIGRSGFADVYAVTFEGYQVACKKLSPAVSEEERKQLKEIFPKLTAVRGPPLLPYIGISADASIILVERSKRGAVDNADLLNSIDFERKVKIARGLCEGLNLLHTAAEPILHRRLKPSNIMLTSDNKIKLAEFGRPFSLTKDHIISGGYLPYLAPEVLKGQPATKKSDIYSYAMCLYFIFTGTAPYDGVPELSAVDKFVAYSEKHKPNLDGVAIPVLLKGFLNECWATNPDSRPEADHILRKLRPWDSWIIENSQMKKGDASEVWPGGVDGAKMKWKEFFTKWDKQFPRTSEKNKNMLKVLIEGTLVPDDSDIEHNKWEMFLYWFGPISQANIPKLWNFLDKLVKKETGSFFHGNVNGSVAKVRLRGKKGAKEGSTNGFLLRLNTKTEEAELKAVDKPFIITYRKDDKTHEVPIALKFDKEPLAQVQEVLKLKKCPDLPPCSSDRNPAFDRVHADTTGHSGRGYVTVLVQPIDEIDGDD